MKCDFCNKDISNKDSTTSKGCKYHFCNYCCLEDFYIQKIEQLTISEKNWHEEWYKQREIIGQLGYQHCIPDSYKE